MWSRDEVESMCLQKKGRSVAVEPCSNENLFLHNDSLMILKLRFGMLWRNKIDTFTSQSKNTENWRWSFIIISFFIISITKIIICFFQLLYFLLKIHCYWSFRPYFAKKRYFNDTLKAFVDFKNKQKNVWSNFLDM